MFTRDLVQEMQSRGPREVTGAGLGCGAPGGWAGRDAGAFYSESMRLQFFGGFAAEDAAGSPLQGRGSRQRALLPRLRLGGGKTGRYPAPPGDVLPRDPPEDPPAAPQVALARGLRAPPRGRT